MYRKYGMPRAHGCAGAAMYRKYGMPRAHGCAGAAMYRMYGMPRAHGCTGAAMYRMYGMPRVQDDIQGRISVARSRMLGATAQERRCTGTYWQIFAPAISALPPSMRS